MSEPGTQRRVLVTGAGSGIGQAVAERLARSGWTVTGTVRDSGRAESLGRAAEGAGLTLRFLPLDFAVPVSVTALADRVASDGGLDVVVHNAGAGVFGSVEDVGADLVAAQLVANLIGPLDLTRRLLPGLRARRGRVIWIGSLAGRLSLPFQAHYSASKAAVAAISDAMRMELAPSGVQVTCVEPGDFATGFTSARRVVSSDTTVYRDAQTRCLAAVERQERTAPGPAQVAEAIERLCRMPRPPARLPVGPGARLTCLAHRLLPDALRELIVRKHYDQ
jgi:NAD(P)-dependent dehydrogenase (short-subunit alcohol dehydrogenase family)